jgi:hypothetical protein
LIVKQIEIQYVRSMRKRHGHRDLEVSV